MILFLRMFAGCLTQLSPYAFLCLYPFQDHFRFAKKKMILFTTLLLTGLSLLFAVVCIILAAFLPKDYPFLMDIINLVFLLCLIPCLVCYFYIVKVIWQQKLFIFSFTLTCALIITFISNYIMNYIDYSIFPNLYDPNGFPYGGFGIPITLLTTAVFFPFLMMLIKYFYLPVRDGLDRKESGYLAFLSLALFILLVSGLSFINITYLVINPMILFLFAALLISVIVVYIVIFRMFYLAQERALLQQENIQAQHQLELNNEQYHRIMETIQATSRLRHDIKHHIFALQGFLAEGDTAKIEAYLSEYLDMVNKYEVMNLCSNPIVNMTVSYYYTLAKDNLIDFTTRINIPKELPIQDSDLSVLLGNLLENAITATASSQEDRRKILLNMIVSGKTLVVTVDNGFGGNVAYKNGEYLSTKPAHKGLGLKSIASIANKYNGDVEFTHEDGVFHSSVMLEY